MNPTSRPKRRRRVRTKPPTRPAETVDIAVELIAADSVVEERRVGMEYAHVSSLQGMCPREQALAHLSEDTVTEHPQAAMRIVWALGRAAETHVRAGLIRRFGKDSVLGDWTCPCGSFTREFSTMPDGGCQDCGNPAAIYVETDLVDDEYRITGHPDMLWYDDAGKINVIEIKSIKRDGQGGYKTLSCPKVEHVAQVLTYREILRREHGDDAIGRADIIYVAKDYVFGSPYKVYSVDPAQYEFVVDQGLEKAALLAGYHEDEEMPPRLSLCRGLSSPRAKACSQCVACFSWRD